MEELRKKKYEVTIPKYVSDVHKMWLAHNKIPLKQPIMKADTKVTNPPIRPNGNKGTA